MIFIMQYRIQCTVTGCGQFRGIKVFIFTRRLYPYNKRGWRRKIRVRIRKKTTESKTTMSLNCCRQGNILTSTLVNSATFHAKYFMWGWKKTHSPSKESTTTALTQFRQENPTQKKWTCLTSLLFSLACFSTVTCHSWTVPCRFSGSICPSPLHPPQNNNNNKKPTNPTRFVALCSRIAPPHPTLTPSPIVCLVILYSVCSLCCTWFAYY